MVAGLEPDGAYRRKAGAEENGNENIGVDGMATDSASGIKNMLVAATMATCKRVKPQALRLGVLRIFCRAKTYVA